MIPTLGPYLDLSAIQAKRNGQNSIEMTFGQHLEDNQDKTESRGLRPSL
jgi:hypothetical protein